MSPEQLPLPEDIYAYAGIDPQIPHGISRVEAMRRVDAYKNAKAALMSQTICAEIEIQSTSDLQPSPAESTLI